MDTDTRHRNNDEEIHADIKVATPEWEWIEEEEDCRVDKEVATPDWGWIVVFAAFVVELLTGTAKHSFGVIYSRYFLHLGTSTFTITFIYNVAYILSFILTFIFSHTVSEGQWMLPTFISGSFYAVGLILSAFSLSTLHICLSFTILSGPNIMFLTTMAQGISQKYFPNNGKVTIITTSGFSIGQLLMPLIITWLYKQFGFHGSTLITGALMMNVCVCAMIFQPVQWHQKIRSKIETYTGTKNRSENEIHDKTQIETTDNINIETYGKTQIEKYAETLTKTRDQMKNERAFKNERALKNESGLKNERALKKEKVLKNISLLKSPIINIITIITSLNFFALVNIGPTVPFAMMSDGFELEQAALCMSMSGLCNVLTKLSILILPCDLLKQHPLLIYTAASTVSGAALYAFSQVDTLVLRAVSLGICGIGASVIGSVWNPILEHQLGQYMIQPVNNITTFMSAIIILIMATILGIVGELTASFRASLCVLAATFILSGILCLSLHITNSTTYSPQNFQLLKETHQTQDLKTYDTQNLGDDTQDLGRTHEKMFMLKRVMGNSPVNYGTLKECH